MGVQMSGKLIQYKSTEITHGPSGATLKTTAPVDNGGDGSQFSPTDLMAASLGACAITVVGLYAEKHAINLEEMQFKLEKEMSQTAPRRIGKLTVHFSLKTNCSEEDFSRLIKVAKTCPVRHSLLESIEVHETYTRV